MAKLNFAEKEIAREFKVEIAEMNGEIFYCVARGISMVIMPNDRMNGFVRIYMAYCSPKDKFSKKRGRLMLKDRVYNDNYILYPVAGEDYTDIAQSFMYIR